MKLKIFILLSPLLLVISCSNIKVSDKDDNLFIKPYPHIINMAEGLQNKTQLKLSDIADSIRYIVLSKEKKVILGDVMNLQMSDSNIYLKSNELVMRFDLSGNLLNTFGNIGRGPAEYLQGSPYTTSPDFRRVMILKSAMYEYLIYKPDGELIGRHAFPHNRNLFNYVSLSDSSFLMTFFYVGTFMKEEYLSSIPGIAGIFDMNCKPISIIENPLKNIKLSNGDFKRISIVNPSFKFFDNRIVLAPDGDTIYEIDKNSIKPGFIFNWGHIPHKKGAEDFYFRQTEPSNKSSLSKQFLETTTKAFFRGNSANSDFLFEYDKSSGLSRSMNVDENNYGFINDLDGGASYFPYWTNRVGDIWITYEDAFSFKESHSDEILSKSGSVYLDMKEKLRKFRDNLKDDDNPVIKIVYLKK